MLHLPRAVRDCRRGRRASPGAKLVDTAPSPSYSRGRFPLATPSRNTFRAVHEHVPAGVVRRREPIRLRRQQPKDVPRWLRPPRAIRISPGPTGTLPNGRRMTVSDASPQETNKVDSYTLVNCLFTGKFSQVWEVIEEGTPLRYAMKLLLPEYTREREQVQSLKWEAKIGKQLEHPNLLTYHKIVTTRDHAYLLMDLFRSMSLKNFLSSDLLGVQLRIRKLVESLCLVLGYMHDKGWVHKDVKPDNILLNKG
ncbi:MAG TPA: protein kinase family protein, partial [Planctomycetaceae bacterium]|nr:protein kinase family protein [Planctomycetaceae bacterium]